MIITNMPSGVNLESTTATAAQIFSGKTAYNGDKVKLTGTALATTTTAAAANILSGYTAYNNSGTLITGTALATSTTAAANKILSGYTAYNNSGSLITGTALGTTTTATADMILSGYTAYNNTGTLITGTMVPSGGFGDFTWSQIKNICDSGLAATYISEGIWSIGETKTTSELGTIRLIHCLTDSQRSSSYYNTSAHIVVEFADVINTCKYCSGGEQKYFESGYLHTMCNTTIYNSLSSLFKSILSPWTCRVGKENGGWGSTSGTYSQSVYLAAPSCKELGSTNGYNADENNACFTFDYYNDSSTVSDRRIKYTVDSTSATYWWTRSPSHYETSNECYESYYVKPSGAIESAIDWYVSGVSPIMCI